MEAAFKRFDEHLANCSKTFGYDPDNVANEDAFEVEPIADFPATSSKPSGPFWEAISRAMTDLTGSARLLPTLMPATTDARFFRARGTVAYGVGLFDQQVHFDDFLGIFHGNNERVGVESLGLTAELLGRVIEEVGAG